MVLFKQVRVADEPIVFNSNVKETILKQLFFRQKQLCEKSFTQSKHALMLFNGNGWWLIKGINTVVEAIYTVLEQVIRSCQVLKGLI